MDEKQQDLAWACLPKEARENISYSYKNSPCGSWVENLFEEIYGEHNLTSDAEPHELLYVERKKVQELYARFDKYQQEATMELDKDFYKGEQNALVLLFGDKCLPDKEEQNIPKLSNSFQIGKFFLGKNEQPMPKFNVGDIVMAIDNIRNIHPNPMTISKIIIGDEFIRYEVKENSIQFHQDNLEPYTEENKETMKEKELNLCELLKGCVGKEVYSLLEGVTFIRNVGNALITTTENNNYTEIGSIYVGGVCLLYPSKELYEKYSLDAYSAWMEWKESRKPKYALQAQIRLISNNGKTIEDYECVEVEVSDIDLTQAAEAVKKALQEFHESHAAD